MTYDLSGTGKIGGAGVVLDVLRPDGPRPARGQPARIGQVSIRYPWADLNGDTFVQAGELNLTNFATSYLTKSASFDPANPTSFLSPGAVDPNIKNDRTREVRRRLQQELMRNLAVEVNYVWRKYDQFTWTDCTNWDTSNFVPLDAQPDQLRTDRGLRAGDLLPRERGCSRSPTSAPTSRTASVTTTVSSSR